MTAFGRLAGNYLEAGWLLIAVAAALLFQVVSIRSFDFPRVIFLLILIPWLVGAALVAVAAGATAAERRIAASGLFSPRALPWSIGGLFLASYAISTALSIVPNVSLWGSRFNSEGLLAAAGYVSLFVLVATFMRRPDQVRRLIDVVLLASIPVALYGVAQFYAYDPLAAAMSQQLAGGRIVSSLGNPILAGGYGAILLPITLARLLGAWRSWRRAPLEGAGGDVGSSVAAVVLPVAAIVLLQAAALAFFLWTAARYSQLWWVAPLPLVLFLLPALVVPRAAPAGRRGAMVALAGYALLFGLQFLLFYLARSRGPFVAAPIAMGVVLLLLLETRRARVLFASAAAGVAILILALVGLPAIARANPALESSPIIQAVSRLGGPGNTVSSRWLIWGGVIDLATGGEDVGIPTDRFSALRPLIGYGPETLAMAYERVATLEAREAEPYRISRAHNEPLDYWATRGLVGLAVWALTLLALAWAALRGWRREGTDRIALSGAAGGVAAYAGAQLFEPNDPSLSLHFWLLAGLLLSRALQDPASAPADAPPVESRLPVAARREAVRGRGTARGRVREARRTAPRAASLGASTEAASARRWAVGAFVLAGGLLLGMYAALAPSYELLGALLILWLALTLAGIAWVFLPTADVPTRSELARAGLFAVPVVLVAAVLSYQPFRRFEADAYSKYGVEAARRADHASAFALSRSAVALAPDDELYYSNMARTLASIANAAPDRPLRPDFRPSLGLLFGIQPQQIGQFSKRELLVLTQIVLERAIEQAPLEPDNRLNLSIVHRALGDLGEPDRYDLAREQLDTLRRMSPTQSIYPQQIAELESRRR